MRPVAVVDLLGHVRGLVCDNILVGPAMWVGATWAPLVCALKKVEAWAYCILAGVVVRHVACHVCLSA